jgi:Uma2 family endonuclease
MSQVAEKVMTFEEFASLNSEGRYELVNGTLEELVPPRPKHGWTAVEFAVEVVAVVKKLDPEGYWGSEVDISTVSPFHGRRPDLVHYSGADAAVNLDLAADRVLGVPTLAVEILSEEDEDRDLVTKRDEYARAGIRHYWIFDPKRRTAATLMLVNGRYEVAGSFTADDTLTSDLFPGLAVPLHRLFR